MKKLIIALLLLVALFVPMSAEVVGVQDANAKSLVERCCDMGEIYCCIIDLWMDGYPI